MSKLPYLVSEINAALEVYLSGRTGQQYNRTAFILCDDGAELASKLFLINDAPPWSDKKANGNFKNFRDVTVEVGAVFLAKRPKDHALADALLTRIEARRERRNEFFHSTSLLDLNFHARDCVEASCDLLDYGKLLFLADWEKEVAAAGNMVIFGDDGFTDHPHLLERPGRGVISGDIFQRQLKLHRVTLMPFAPQSEQHFRQPISHSI